MRINKRKAYSKIVTAAMALLMVGGLCGLYASADEPKTILVNNNDNQQVSMYVGDGGSIVPQVYIKKQVAVEVATTEHKSTTEVATTEEKKDASGDGKENISNNKPDASGDAGETANPVNPTTEEPARTTEIITTEVLAEPGEVTLYYTSSDEEVVKVDSSGQFTTLKPGTAEVNVWAYDLYGYEIFRASINFTVSVNMTNVTLGKSKLTGYMVKQYVGTKLYSSPTFTIPVKSDYILSEDVVDVKCKSSNKKIKPYVELQDNKLTITMSSSKNAKGKLTVTIAGKEFYINVTLKKVDISDNGYILQKGKTKRLTLTNSPSNVVWKSSNKKVAVVSKKGVVKGKGYGNCVISATIDGQKIGCAVSVTTKKMKVIVNYANYIGNNWKYSQPLRARSGYYDCSSLVWKAYMKGANYYFGTRYYPGNTATESVYCRNHGKMIKGGFKYKMISKMKLRPGDIVFKSTNPKNPYGTTYHVEMFTGYICTGFNEDGKPMIIDDWGAREPGYGGGIEKGSLLARPLPN